MDKLKFSTAKPTSSATQQNTPATPVIILDASTQPQVRAEAHVVHKKPIHKINKSTLMVGSSILKGVKVSSLTSITAVRTFPGATINKISTELSNMNIEQCKTIILHVGGNHADEGLVWTHSLRDTKPGRKLVVSGLLPRDSVDLKRWVSVHLQSIRGDKPDIMFRGVRLGKRTFEINPRR